MPKAKKATKQTRKLNAGKKSESVKPLTQDLHFTKVVDKASPKL
jgi:type VI protein secretion system component Hcp